MRMARRSFAASHWSSGSAIDSVPAGDAFYYPLGDAWRSLRAFVALLNGEPSDFAERWEADLLP